MKLFSVSQIKEWDAYTLQQETISSTELMERAAVACFNWIAKRFDATQSFKIFCGKGNNGGDGLAIARLLIENDYKVSVFIVESKATGSADFEINLEKLRRISNEIHFLKEESTFPSLESDVIIEALFGTGLNKKPAKLYLRLIEYINQFPNKVISIDVPGGLYVDESSKSASVIQADVTLTFQNQKLAFMMAENGPFTGEVVLLNIQLSKDYEEQQSSRFELVDRPMVRELYIKRDAFANKGNYGYACLLAGSYGMMGAAILSSRACLRSGVGKLTTYTCKAGFQILQSSVPEAMCKTFGNSFIKEPKDFKNFNVIGIGPGIGKHSSHKKLLQQLFTGFKKPVVIDADALNVLSENPSLYKSIPEGSIVTPHPKEFERLFGKSDSDFGKINLALEKARELNIYIVLKGHFTFIAAPDGKGYFNSTGNAGMATAGSGDVLTGIITGLLAQKYSSLHACILGAYLHGLAGDFAAAKTGQEALIASDIINCMGQAFLKISSS